MKAKLFTEEFARKFKKKYRYTMGGEQTIIMPNGQEFYFNDKEYYSGRGAKYNSSVRHDNLGIVKVTKKQVMEEQRKLREIERIKKANGRRRKESVKRIKEMDKIGYYPIGVYFENDSDWRIYDDRYKNEKILGDFLWFFVELSEEEEDLTKEFNAEKLAKTLCISVKDAELLRSGGKTYVFAKTDNGEILQLYHSALGCNNLYITVQKVTEEQYKKFAEEWGNPFDAPFASLVGQTEAENHFVC